MAHTKTTAAMLALALAMGMAARASENDGATKFQAPINHSPYEVNLGLDLGIAGASIFVLGLPRMMNDELVEPWCGLNCDTDDLNAIDRRVVGNRSHTADLISDVGAGTFYALPYVLTAIDVLATNPQDGWSGFGTDSVVYLQTLTITLATNNLLGYTFRRPRPLVYDDSFDDEIRLAGDSALSFPSGHTSGSFAMATAYSYTFMKRHPDSAWVVPVWLGSYALAATTGVLRTEAGEHFWTDVIGGAVLGVGLGLLIPYLHLRDEPDEDPDATDQASPPLSISIAPMLTPGGVGAALTIR
jgi:membrane-associated phospholipid phosphatase